jgi:hypothetical protein
MPNKEIEYLKTLPDNSGQIVEIETSNGIKQFYFMWFHDEKRIDLKPCDNINIFRVQEKHWNKIKLVF